MNTKYFELTRTISVITFLYIEFICSKARTENTKSKELFKKGIFFAFPCIKLTFPILVPLTKKPS